MNNIYISYHISQHQYPCKKIKSKEAQFWNQFAPIYNQNDSSSLTFYYSIINMLQLPHAKHILEVAIGTGKLLHEAIKLKPDSATYLGVDISPVMVQMSKKSLENFIKKMEVEKPIDEWMKNKKISLRLEDGEEKIKSQHKFDRIIANLVVHIVPDPIKMLKNLWEVAEEGCLLGVSVWAGRATNNFFGLQPSAMQAQGKTVNLLETPYSLHTKLKELGQKAGWQTILVWQQNAPFPVLEPNENLNKLISAMSDNDPFIHDYILKGSSKFLANKEALTFGGEIAIFRKK